MRLATHRGSSTGIGRVVYYGIRPLEESGQAVLREGIRENGRCEQEGGDEGRTEEHSECYLWMAVGKSEVAVDSEE